MENHQHMDAPKIAYLLNIFPVLAETFVLYEMLELERQGVSLRVFSLWKESSQKEHRAVSDLQARVTYIPSARHFPLGTLTLIAYVARRFLKAPWRFLHTCIVGIAYYHQASALRHLLYAAYLADQLEREGITHIHAHFANRPASIALFVHLLTGISYSFTAHAFDIYLSSKKELASKMRMASFMVTCTAYNWKYLAGLVDQYTSERLHLIYHGLNLRAFPSNPSRPSPSASPLILAVARLIEKKGLPYLLRACRILKDQGYDFTCCIVGEGPLRPLLEQEIRELELTDTVKLWGAETHERVINMYQQATITAMPCIISKNGDRDGLANVLVESLYMGVPVVSTTVSAFPECITSEVNGLLVPPNDSAAFAAALARLLDDPELRQRLAAAGRQVVLERFDMARNTTTLRHLLCPGRESVMNSSLCEDITTASVEVDARSSDA